MKKQRVNSELITKATGELAEEIEKELQVPDPDKAEANCLLEGNSEDTQGND